jgi:hypothetical protein
MGLQAHTKRLLARAFLHSFYAHAHAQYYCATAGVPSNAVRVNAKAKGKGGKIHASHKCHDAVKEQTRMSLNHWDILTHPEGLSLSNPPETPP